MKHLDVKPLVRQVNPDIALTSHVAPVTVSDKIAFSFVKLLRFLPIAFFQSAMATGR